MSPYWSYILSMLTCLSIALSREASSQTINNGPYLIIQDNMNSGMFATFSSVLAALDYYDKNTFEGFKVNLTSGIYLDPETGPNWWNYYFEPINLGDENSRKYTFSPYETLKFSGIGFWLPRERAYELIQKYIRIRPDIQLEVDAFVKKHFEDHYVIGVHHRGTDKVSESPLVPYEKTCHRIDQIIETLLPSEKKKVRIYIATDDQTFFEYIFKRYPSNILYNDFVRSSDSNPIHYNTTAFSSNYQKGKEALIDCLLLSRANVLVRPLTSSLSIMSGHFNPTMPIVKISAY